MRVVCDCCYWRNNFERRLAVVRLIRPYPCHTDGVSDGDVGADSDTDSDDVDSADADESADELVSASESVADKLSAPDGKH